MNNLNGRASLLCTWKRLSCSGKRSSKVKTLSAQGTVYDSDRPTFPQGATHPSESTRSTGQMDVDHTRLWILSDPCESDIFGSAGHTQLRRILVAFVSEMLLATRCMSGWWQRRRQWYNKIDHGTWDYWVWAKYRRDEGQATETMRWPGRICFQSRKSVFGRRPCDAYCKAWRATCSGTIGHCKSFIGTY